jgi:hypothetical protein
VGTTYKASMSIKCWKQHTCIGCGAVYRYLFTRDKTAQASTPEGAEQAVEKQVADAMQNEVDARPCPTCGILQPEMVGAKRAVVHGWMIALAVVWLIAAMILCGTDVMSLNTVAMISLFLGLIMALANFATVMINPNADLSGNKQEAQKQIKSRTVVLDQNGTSSTPSRVPGSEKFSPSSIAAIAFLAAGALGMGMSEEMRIVRGWPLNSGLYPPVMGPGDTCRLYFPNSVSSVKGYWGGTATIKCSNAKDLGASAARFTATTKESSWGSSISVKSSEKNSSSTLWADVHAPDEEELAGKSASLVVDLSVSYPSIVGSSSFSNSSGKYQASTIVELASPGAGGTYRTLWWGGMIVGALLSAIGSFLFFNMAKGMRTGTPARCFPLEPPAAGPGPGAIAGAPSAPPPPS